MKYWCAFMGWFLSEGCTVGCRGGKVKGYQYKVVISQNYGDKRDLLREDLSKLPFRWNESKTGFETSNKQLWEYLHQFGDRNEKFIPDDIKYSGKDNLLVFIDRMILGDGSHQKFSEIYYTVSRRLAYDLKDVCMLAGISCFINRRDNKPKEKIKGRTVKTCKELYYVILRRRKWGMVKTHELIDYDGFIGCVTVSSGLILVRRNGEEVICGNCGWLKHDIIDKAKGGHFEQNRAKINGGDLLNTINHEANINLIQYDSIINPLFSHEEFTRLRETMPDDEFSMFYKGMETKLRTLIYDVFDEPTMSIEPFNIPNTWPHVVGIDPMGEKIAALWFAINPETFEPFIVDEYYEPFGVTTIDHVHNILQQSSHRYVIAYVGGGPSERQARADFAGAGINLQEPPFSDVWSQIMRAYALFKSGGMKVFNKCENLLSEIGSYQRKKDKAGNVTDIIDHDEIYHLCSCMRYGAAWITEPPEVQEIEYHPVQIGRRY